MRKILLLEDDISLVDGLKYSLKKNGFDVEVARTVCEAIKYLAEISKYDLLILDVTVSEQSLRFAAIGCHFAGRNRI